MDQRAHELIDRIYAAALDPDAWQDVTQGVSDLFDGAPTMLGFMIPGETVAGPRYAVGIPEAHWPSYFEHMLKDLPWSVRYMYEFTDHWGSMGDVLGHVVLAETGLYSEWMKPLGLAPAWPIGVTIANEQGEAMAGFSVFTREGAAPFREEQFALANQLIGHFRRALEVHVTLQGVQRVHLALAEAIDRLPTGVLLLDAKRNVVVQNAGAERIVAANDGFRIDRNGPAAEDARENATLQRLIADALEVRAGEELSAAGFVAVSRPSGERAYAVMVTPLLANPGGTMASDAVAALFVADPSARMVTGSEALTELYQLTHSEAELVRLLAAGLSLEEAAAKRGVSLNTARSHLKHVFAKTETSRQGELVRLVVTGLGQIRDE